VNKAKVGLIGIISEEIRRDLWGTLEQVAKMGYQGIEGGPMQLLEGDSAANLRRFHDLGLRVLTVSASREQLRDRLEEIAETARKLQAPRVTVWWGPCDSRENLLRDAELYNEAGSKLKEHGLKLCYHNHDHEFRTTYNGLYALDVLAEHTDPQSLYFELDIAWITVGGEDPSKVLRRMAGRVPAIHVKDVLMQDGKPIFTGLGTGIVKIKEAVQTALDTGVEWVVVEQDKLKNLSAMDTLALSYLHLKESDLI